MRKAYTFIILLSMLTFFLCQGNAFAIQEIKLPSLFNSSEKVSLSDFKGKVLLLNFWTINCPYCKMELPILSKTQANFSEDIKIISILYARYGDIDEAKRWIREKNINNIVFLLDEEGRAFKEFNVIGVPYTVFFDRDGNKVTELRGAFPEEVITSVIRKVLGK